MERKLSETEEVRNLDCLNGGLEHRNVLIVIWMTEQVQVYLKVEEFNCSL